MKEKKNERERERKTKNTLLFLQVFVESRRNKKESRKVEKKN